MSKTRRSVVRVDHPSMVAMAAVAGLALLVVCYPLPFAGMHEWARHTLRLLLIMVTAIWLYSPEAKLEERIRELTVGRILTILPLVGILAILLVGAIHGGPGTRYSGHLLSPGPSADALLEIFELFCLALVSTCLLDHNRGRIQFLTNVLIASGCFQALYGLSQFFSGSNLMLGLRDLGNERVASGSFVNPDHFSAYLEMVLPLCMGYIVSRRRSPSGMTTLKEKILALGHESFQKSIIYILAAFIIALGIMFSKCRSGFIVLLASMLVLATSGGAGKKSAWTRKWVAAFLLLLCIAGLWISYNPMFSKLARTASDKSVEDRMDIWRTSLRIVGDYPWFGIGPGVMGSVYPKYESVDTGFRYDFAHQVYIQLAVEYGLMGLALWLTLAGIFTVRLYRGWNQRHHPFPRGIAAGCLVGILAMYLHGFTDFALSIPANQLTFLMLYCLGFSAVRWRRE